MDDTNQSELPIPVAEVDDGTAVAQRTEEWLPEWQFCIFRVGREQYALSVLEVEEVVKLVSVTRMPLAPTFLIGISNLRGIIVPVVDIAFAEAARGDALPPRMIVAAAAGKSGPDTLRVGLAADEVVATYFTREPPRTEEAPCDIPYCRGVLTYEGRRTLVLDFDRFMETFLIAPT
jgi:purine-binding chemotaxis protein CheW